MNEKLLQSIINTLAYFNLFGHPLTSEELYRWLWDYKRIEYADFLKDLEQLKDLQHFGYRQGFYFLSGRDNIVEKRQKRIRMLEQKMKIAVRGVKKLRWVPFVKAIFVCNTLALGSVSEDSDIDLFIVTQRKRIWLVRFFCTILLKLFRLRTGKRGIKNKICLSFFVDENSLNLSPLRVGDPDIYLAYWIDQLIPIYDSGGVRDNMMRENGWVKDYLINSLRPFVLLSRWKVCDNSVSKVIKFIFEKLWGGAYGDMIEKQAKGAQISRLKIRNLLKGEENTNVVISDSVLKFHENDRREYYRQAWLQAVGKSSKL